MKNYVVIYTGVSAAGTDQAAVTTAWKQWFQELGAAVVDPGNPFGLHRTVTTDRTIEIEDKLKLTGYSILQAENIEAAAAIVKGCPGLANADITVYEAVPFGRPATNPSS